MSRRELILAIATVSVLALGLIIRFTPVLSFGRGPGGAAGTEAAQFEQNMEWIERGPLIREAYREVEAQFPETIGNRTPEATFSDELTRMMKEQGWQHPRIRPPRTSEIPDVEDYYFIDLEVEVTGELQAALRLLSAFQNTGLLIKSFNLTKPNPDANVVNMDVTVSRLARADQNGARRLR